jgi:hypothetical protein
LLYGIWCNDRNKKNSLKTAIQRKFNEDLEGKRRRRECEFEKMQTMEIRKKNGWIEGEHVY